MRRPTWGTVALVAAVAVGVALRFGPAIGVVLGFALLTPLERRWRRHDQPVRRPGLGTDVLHLLFTGVLQNAMLLVGAGLVLVLLRPFTITPVADAVGSWPLPAQAAVGFVLFEVGAYWYHRASHTIPFLWRFHAVHHSSEHLDWIAAARLHPVEGFFGGVAIAPGFVLLGVQPAQIAVLSALATVWAILIHANVSWRLAWMDGWFGSHEYHHWHHSNHPEARNRNFSGLMPVLDRVFGTYYLPTHRRPAVYGIDDPMPTSWWGQLRQPLRRRRQPVLEAF